MMHTYVCMAPVLHVYSCRQHHVEEFDWPSFRITEQSHPHHESPALSSGRHPSECCTSAFRRRTTEPRRILGRAIRYLLIIGDTMVGEHVQVVRRHLGRIGVQTHPSVMNPAFA